MDKLRTERPVIHKTYPTVEIAGVIYDAAAIEAQREIVIQMRDASLEQGAMDWAVALSHTIALLAHMATMFKAELETKQ